MLNCPNNTLNFKEQKKDFLVLALKEGIFWIIVTVGECKGLMLNKFALHQVASWLALVI